ncbi:hypothetical protein ACFCWG_39635 [Streptomyces sp. NPDC056390]|uniref:phosphotriesterase family protein n=1 Tax=Streptomyces sp. NPDC056390 TaxID=3345806 RepID=UPI0035E1B9BE
MPLLPQWHCLHIADEVLPYLERRGVTEEQIDTMLVDVPCRCFEAGATGVEAQPVSPSSWPRRGTPG